MSKLVADQADGLRRLLAPKPTRVIAVAGMGQGAGGTTAAMNLGVALVQQGKSVLLLDEHCPKEGSACEVWAIDPLGSLADVASHRLTLDGADVQAGCGVHVLPAPPGVAPDTTDPRTLWPEGVVIVDAAFDSEGRLSPLARAADDLLLVLKPHPASITSAYAGIKNLHYAHGLKQLRFLINGVVDVDGAHQIMNNLANAGSRYLALSLLPAGLVRFDARIPDAWRLKQTIAEAFPASAAAVDFRRLADDVGRWPWRAAVPLQAA